MITYQPAPELQIRLREIIQRLEFTHIDPERVTVLRSYGSRARRTVARLHGLSRVMQLALDRPALYVVEVIAERFERLSEEDQLKVLIHELLHIPRGFGGGFRPHRPYVTRATVEKAFRRYQAQCRGG